MVSSPYGGGYQQPAYSPNYGFVLPTSQGPPYYGTSTSPYTGQTGGGHYGHGQVVLKPMCTKERSIDLIILGSLSLRCLIFLTYRDLRTILWLMKQLGQLSLPRFLRTYLISKENQERIRANTLLRFTFGALQIRYIKTQSVCGYFNASSQGLLRNGI